MTAMHIGTYAQMKIRNLGNHIQTEAFRAFDRWVKDHDPDGAMDFSEQAIAYSEWAEKNSIEKYLDAAQLVRPKVSRS